jgi:hypothetical protein
MIHRFEFPVSLGSDVCTVRFEVLQMVLEILVFDGRIRLAQKIGRKESYEAVKRSRRVVG